MVLLRQSRNSIALSYIHRLIWCVLFQWHTSFQMLMIYCAFSAVFIRSIYTKCTINPPSLHIVYHIRHSDKHKDTDIWKLVNVIGDLACYLYRYAIILNLVINMDWHYCTDLFLTICSLIVIVSPSLPPCTSAECVGRCSPFASTRWENNFSAGHHDEERIPATMSPKSD